MYIFSENCGVNMVRKLRWKNLYEIRDELMEYKQDFILDIIFIEI